MIIRRSVELEIGKLYKYWSWEMEQFEEERLSVEL